MLNKTIVLEKDIFATCSIYESASSSLDIAHALVQENSFPLWSSVLVGRQTKGRGQRGHVWSSEGKNLYSALHLPKDGLFCSQATAPIIGTLLIENLKKIYMKKEILPQTDFLLKWTNDIFIRHENNYFKIGGILLEEKNDALIAGIGLNLYSSPSSHQIDGEKTISATHLSKYFQLENDEIFSLWSRLVNSLYLCYTNKVQNKDLLITEHDTSTSYQSISATENFEQKKEECANNTLFSKKQEIDYLYQKKVLERLSNFLAYKGRKVKIIEALPFDCFDYNETDDQITSYIGYLLDISLEKESFGGIILETDFGRRTFVSGRISLL